MVDTGYADDVVEVIDEGAQGGAGDLGGEVAVDCVGDGEGNGLVCGAVGGGSFGLGGFAGGAEAFPGVVPGAVDEAGVEVNHDEASSGGDGANLVVGQVAGDVGEGAGGGVGGDDGGAGGGEHVGKGLVGDVGYVDDHPEGVHFVDDFATEGGQTPGARGEGAGRLRPVVGVGPGEGDRTDAEAIEGAEEGQVAADGMAPFEGEDDGELSGGVGCADVGGGEG